MFFVAKRRRIPRITNKEIVDLQFLCSVAHISCLKDPILRRSVKKTRRNSSHSTHRRRYSKQSMPSNRGLTSHLVSSDLQILPHARPRVRLWAYICICSVAIALTGFAVSVAVSLSRQHPRPTEIGSSNFDLHILLPQSPKTSPTSLLQPWSSSIVPVPTQSPIKECQGTESDPDGRRCPVRGRGRGASDPFSISSTASIS